MDLSKFHASCARESFQYQRLILLAICLHCQVSEIPDVCAGPIVMVRRGSEFSRSAVSGYSG